MKRMMMFAIVCVLLTAPAYAVSLTLQMQGVVGSIEGGEASADVATVTPMAQFLLDMGMNQVFPVAPASAVYKTNTVFDYSGTLTGGVRIDGGSNDVTGYDWVLAKYNGPNAGWVLFKLTGDDAWQGSTIPLKSDSLWTVPGPSGSGYDLSNFTGYRTAVPEGGMTLILLGGALLGLETLRRRIRA